MKFFLFTFALLIFGSNIYAVEGCLVDNSFYTTPIGMVSTSNNSFYGKKKVFEQRSLSYQINYQNYDVCNTVKANDYRNLRDGDLCFVMPYSQLTSYPNGVAPTYPSRNGTLQNFEISCVNLPLDDYTWLLVLGFGGVGALFISKGSIFKCVH
jgi:hypothetical protein